MSGTKTFKSYNFVTGAVDGTLAYDFGSPALEREEETVFQPRRTRERLSEQPWVKEDTSAEAVRDTAEVHRRSILPVMNILLGAAAAVLMVMMLLSQIQLADISYTAVCLEDQIEELRTEQSVLQVEYESVFNLKDVEEYAVNVLGMRAPREDQIVYLTGVNTADEAIVVTRENAELFSLGLEDIVASVRSYLHISG